MVDVKSFLFSIDVVNNGSGYFHFFFCFILWYRGVYRTKYCKISSHRGLYWLKCCQFSSPSGQLFWRWFKHTKKYYEYKSVTNKNHCQPQLPEYVICKKKKNAAGTSMDFLFFFLFRAENFFLRMISAEKNDPLLPQKLGCFPISYVAPTFAICSFRLLPPMKFGCSHKNNC